jgi:hypothetical protein
VANWYNVDTLTASPSPINFLIFASLWSIISVVYLEVVTKFFPRGMFTPLSNQETHSNTYPAAHPYAALAFEFTNVTFFFSGFIALGVFLSQLLFCRGTVCAAAQADTAFSAFLFCTWGVTIFFAARDIMKAGFRKPIAAKMNGGLPMKETMA